MSDALEPPTRGLVNALNPYFTAHTGKQDDLCIALQLASIGCSKFFQDARYRAFRTHDHTAGAAGLRPIQGPSSGAPFAR